jgi:hypothetical protein
VNTSLGRLGMTHHDPQGKMIMASPIAIARAAACLFGLIALLAALQASPAAACMGPHTRTFPVCEISTPRDGERVTAIYVHGGQGLSSVALGSDDQVTEVVDIEVEAGDKPHYIALSSGKPVIWRFTGRVDTVSRVVVFGSQLSGSSYAGIVGIDPGRILFTKADLEKLKNIRATTCDSFYSACEISSYFDVSKAGRMELAGPAPARRHRVDQFVERFTAGTIRIPQDGWIEIGIPDPRAAGPAPANGRHEAFRGFFYSKSSQSYERGLIRLDADSVVSQEKVSEYRTLPGPAGIRQLLESGALVPPGTPQFDAAYEKWNESLSRLYGSHLDPSFLFNYHVDYLLTRPARLPAGLLSPVFLVAEDVETPQIPRDALGACLFFADQRELTVAGYLDPRCDRNGLFALGGQHSDLASMTRSLDRKKRWTESEKEECRIFYFEDGSAFFAGIAAKDRSGWGGPGAVVLRRPVDIVIKRPGKIALYLEMWGGPVDWHIKAAPNSELSAVLLGSLDFANRKDVVHGVDQSVPIQQIRWPQAEIRKGSSLTIVANPCREFTPSRYAHLGGPAALALDESLKASAGRGLDRLLRAVNGGDWPPISADGPRLTFVIE